MEISIFDVIGPVMVGPSSSHTAGAAKLARIARLIAEQPFHHVDFFLHGSFAQTYKGHGTDRALVAGALGLRENDERLADAFALAQAQGITYAFKEIELDNSHENSVKICFHLDDGTISEITGSSVGGGQILITGINGFETSFTAASSTLILRQEDKKGVISEIAGLLAENDINIGVMKLSRRAKGDIACCIIETDSPLSDALVQRLAALPHIISVKAVNPPAEDGQEENTDV